MLQSLSRPDSFSSPLLYGPYPSRLGALAGLPKEITPASLETCRQPPLAAKINCSPSPCIVSPSVSLSGERAASLVLSVSPVCYLNWAKMKWWLMLKSGITLRQIKGDFVFFSYKLQGLITLLCDGVPPSFSSCSNKFSTHGPGGKGRLMWSQTRASGFVAAVLSPLVS